MSKMTRALINIGTLLIMLFGMISIFSISGKVLKTAANLIVLNDNIQYYNEQYRKTDAMTEKALEYMEERENNYYNSEDSIVRGFSNLNTLFKLFAILVALASYPFVLYLLFVQFIRTIVPFAKKRKNQRHRTIGNNNVSRGMKKAL